MQRTLRLFARWHIWLGWLVGVPILMWTITGLVMVARPIEEVRGEGLVAPPSAFDPAGVRFPETIGEPIREARLEQAPGSAPMWIVTTAKGSRIRYPASAGSAASPVLKAEASRIATAAYRGTGKLERVTYFPAEDAPLDLRQLVASWQAHFADGSNLYIDDTTGEVLAVRTSGWRLYDFMWGLHIMDLQTREDTHHPILVIFAALSTLGALLGCVLLFRRRKARVRA